MNLSYLTTLAYGFVSTVARSWTTRESPRTPPGSLSILHGLRGITDRRFFLKQAARYGPIFKFSQFTSEVVGIVGLERAHKLLREHPHAIAPCPVPFHSQITGGFLRFMDDATYARYGIAFRKAFGKQVVQAAEPVTCQVARRELERLAQASFDADGGVTPSSSFQTIVFAAFARAFFGFELGTLAFEQFQRAIQKLCEHDHTYPLDAPALESLAQVRTLINARRDQLLEHAPDAPVECALTALHAQNPALPDATCIDNLIFMFQVPLKNVVGLLNWLLVMLGSHPEWIERARDPAQVDADIYERIISETLRLSQSEFLYRRIVRDVEYEGVRLPAGWLLRVCVWESHRDPAVFDAPEEFNPDRFLGRTFSATEYAPFGLGKHSCNGIALTNMICKTGLETLVQSYDLSIVGAEPITREWRHWIHWHPSKNYRVRLTPRL